MFDAPISRLPNKVSKQEDDLARAFSKQMKTIANRGSRHTKAYIVNENLTLYISEDIVSMVEFEYVRSHFSVLSMEDFAKQMEHVLLLVGNNLIPHEAMMRAIVTAKYQADSNTGILLLEY